MKRSIAEVPSSGGFQRMRLSIIYSSKMRQYASGPGQTGGVDPTIAELIYHLALDDEWSPTADSGAPYRRSTLE